MSEEVCGLCAARTLIIVYLILIANEKIIANEGQPKTSTLLTPKPRIFVLKSQNCALFDLAEKIEREKQAPMPSPGLEQPQACCCSCCSC
jgi:hypothetical protein